MPMPFVHRSKLEAAQRRAAELQAALDALNAEYDILSQQLADAHKQVQSWRERANNATQDYLECAGRDAGPLKAALGVAMQMLREAPSTLADTAWREMVDEFLADYGDLYFPEARFR